MDGSQPVEMSEDELIRVLDSQLDLAKEYASNEIAEQRAIAYQMYYGAPQGDEMEGRSQIVCQELAQALDTLLPALMELFVAGDKVVECQPRGPEDVKPAEQATESANYVFSVLNNGFVNIHDCLKDGMLQKIGAYKWRWERDYTVEEEVFEGLAEEQLPMLLDGGKSEIVQATQDEFGMYSVRVRKTVDKGHPVVEVIAPEELLISPTSMSVLTTLMDFIAHAPLKTRSQLIEMGYDRDVIDSLTDQGDDLALSEVSQARKDRQAISASWMDREQYSADPSMRKYRYYECYCKVDFDGDGVAELRRVCMVGRTILHNEVTDHIPMSLWTPKMMPHEVIGISVADDVMDQQLLATTIVRSVLDSLYQSISPRMRVDPLMNAGNPTIDDLLTVVPGGLIRAVAGSVEPITVPFVGAQGFQMLEWVKQEIQGRTGVSRYDNNEVDSNGLNKTATFAKIVQNNAQARVKLYARTFAETALVPCFRGILRLLSKHQDTQFLMRLRNEFIPVDPNAWENEYDFTVNVGLGTGTKEQQLQFLQAIEMAQSAVAQSPLADQLLTPKNIYNVQAKKCNLAGFKDPALFWTDPDSLPPPQPPPPPPPDPRIEAANIKAQSDQQIAGMEAQNEAAEAERQAALDREKAERDARFKVFEAQLEATTEIQIAQMRETFANERARLNDERDAMAAMMQQQPSQSSVNFDIPGITQAVGEMVQSSAGQNEAVMRSIQELAQSIGAVVNELKRPKNFVRGPDGRVSGVQ